MLLFALCTTDNPGTLALADETRLEEVEYPGGQGRLILPKLEELLARWGRTRRDLTHLAVCTGPGSYTGIRVGVSLVRAMGWAKGLPVLGRNSFEILTRAALDLGAQKPLEICLDAGQDRLYACRTPAGVPEARLLTEFLATPFSGISIGSAAVRWREAFLAAGRDPGLAEKLTIPRAAALAAMAKEDIQQGTDRTWIEPKALYLRKSAPEEKLQAASRA